jgi:hypothetical protein
MLQGIFTFGSRMRPMSSPVRSPPSPILRSREELNDLLNGSDSASDVIDLRSPISQHPPPLQVPDSPVSHASDQDVAMQPAPQSQRFRIRVGSDDGKGETIEKPEHMGEIVGVFEVRKSFERLKFTPLFEPLPQLNMWPGRSLLPQRINPSPSHVSNLAPLSLFVSNSDSAPSTPDKRMTRAQKAAELAEFKLQAKQRNRVEREQQKKEREGLPLLQAPTSPGDLARAPSPLEADLEAEKR